MPCMGPGINTVQLEAAYEDIMTILRNKYEVQRWPADNRNREHLRSKLNEQLKEVLTELFIQQACEDF